MIHLIPHATTPGLQRETALHDQAAPGYQQIIACYPTADSFLEHFADSAAGQPLAEVAARLPVPSRVLDIGPGLGKSSIYLARQGHRVSVVEPALGLCRCLEQVSVAYGLPLNIYQVSAEAMDRVPDLALDVCFFNASLHHCDDPLRALLNCHKLLVSGGTLFLLNEPQLRPFMSKARFYRLLEEKPEELAHYGGNEHIYYHREYRSLLKQAGFRQVRTFLAHRYLKAESYLQPLHQRGVSAPKIMARRLYYGGVRTLCRSGWLGQPILEVMKRLSLLQSYFEASKAA
jgi:SAM-dependent methyltransferase